MHGTALALSLGDSLMELVQKFAGLATILECTHERLELFIFSWHTQLNHLGALDRIQVLVQEEVEVENDLARWISAHKDTGFGGFLAGEDANGAETLVDPLFFRFLDKLGHFAASFVNKVGRGKLFGGQGGQILLGVVGCVARL